MKVAVLGGGITGLTTTYEISKKGHSVVLIEKQEILGGLASGFKEEKWKWSLEKNIHHLFSNDKDIIAFAKKTGYKNIIFRTTKTVSLYKHGNNYRTIPLDKPQDILLFPYLGLISKLRTAFTLTFLKISPFISFLYENLSAEKFILFTMGKRAWNVLWKELFRKKFGKYAGIILASFLWARITKRTKKLGYFYGGFDNFINHLERILLISGVEIKTNTAINNITKIGDQYLINNKKYDAVVSTLPTPVLINIGTNILPKEYIKNLKKIKYMHAVSLVLQTSKTIFDDYYWINILDSKCEIMGIVQHTNFMNRQNYNNNHIIYVYNYFSTDDKKIKYSKEQFYNFYIKNLKQIDPDIEKKIIKYNIFIGPFAQPIFDKEFIKNKPDFITPLKNFYIANLDMTYPYDRGTNYAVKLGKAVANLVINVE